MSLRRVFSTAQVDINCDIGESFGTYRIEADDRIIQYISSANIACGFHAGDPFAMNRTVLLAAAHGVEIGAHPGFPDLMGFGRRNLDSSLEEIRNYVIYQVGAALAFWRVHGMKLQHVKAHGSLYNMSVGNEEISCTIAESVAAVDPIWRRSRTGHGIRLEHQWALCSRCDQSSFQEPIPHSCHWFCAWFLLPGRTGPQTSHSSTRDPKNPCPSRICRHCPVPDRGLSSGKPRRVATHRQDTP